MTLAGYKVAPLVAAMHEYAALLFPMQAVPLDVDVDIDEAPGSQSVLAGIDTTKLMLRPRSANCFFTIRIAGN